VLTLDEALSQGREVAAQGGPIDKALVTFDKLLPDFWGGERGTHVLTSYLNFADNYEMRGGGRRQDLYEQFFTN
jgi:hypothetical protein